jgi:hypothetical protein
MSTLLNAMLRTAVKKHYCVYDASLAAHIVEWLERAILSNYNVEAEDDADALLEIVEQFVALYLCEGEES